MAADSAPVATAAVQPAAEYPTLFATYVVRSAETLRQRLAVVAIGSRDDFAHQRDHALHVLTFALGPDEAWPAARDLLLTLAEPMEQAGARSEWLPFLDRGRERSRALADCTAEAELSLRTGHLLRLTSDFEAAERRLAESLCCFHKLGDDAGAARALNQLAYVNCLQHRYDEASQCATAALANLPADDGECAMSFFVLGMVASDCWRWDEAEAHHRAALAIRQRQSDFRRIAWAQQNVGYALQGQGRFAEAIACFTAASRTLDELGDKANWAIVLMNLARTCHLNQQLAEALAFNLAARKALLQVGDRLHAARLTCNLGLTYLALDDPPAALASFQESVTLYTELENAAGRINATSGVALAHLALADYAEAAAVLAPALVELAPLENVPGKAALLHTMSENLARARTALGEAAAVGKLSTTAAAGAVA